MSTFILGVSVQHTVKTKGDMASRLMIIYLNQRTTFSASVSDSMFGCLMEMKRLGN